MGSQLPPKRGTAHPPVFSSCLLWPNGCMDEDTTWFGSRPRPRPHCIRQGPNSPWKGHSSSPPLISAHVCYGYGRPSQLLLCCCSFYHLLVVTLFYCYPVLFLTPNEQCQSTEGNMERIHQYNIKCFVDAKGLLKVIGGHVCCKSGNISKWWKIRYSCTKTLIGSHEWRQCQWHDIGDLKGHLRCF